MKAMEEILNSAHRSINEPGLNLGSVKITKIAGDASLRRYFRLQEEGSSYVMMATEPFSPEKNDFLLVRSYLEKCGIPVPKLLAHEGALGAILLEDLGDNTMLHELNGLSGTDAEEKVYKKALDLLVQFHSGTKAPAGLKPVPGFALAFDCEKLMWEVDLTLEHLFGSYLKRNIPEKEFKIIRDSFVDICKRLEAEPRVFTHRDYHSRNIMLNKSGEMVCIDFQDARMGLRAYDLASILRDSYYQLSEKSVYDLLEYYISQTEKRENHSIDRKAFIQIFDLMSVQRNFKAIGTFTMINAKRNDPSYLRFVGNTFENIRRNLAKFPEYKELLKLLFHYYYF